MKQSGKLMRRRGAWWAAVALALSGVAGAGAVSSEATGNEASAELPPGNVVAQGRGRAVDSPRGSTPSGGRTVYAKRANTEIRGGTERTAPVVATVPAGAALTVIQQEGLRYRVRAGNVEGYVASLNVTDVPPKGGGGRQVVLNDRVGPGERSNVGSIRGLSPMAEEYAVKNGEEEALRQAKQMEQNGEQISEADVDAFLREGGVQQP